MKRIVTAALLTVSVLYVRAQNNPRPITPAEYEKAKTFTIKDLDNDTYAKFDNLYILDRYEMKKPYFITGDDSLRKRIDLYKLIAKEGMQELGTVIFYTNEKGKLYTALQPNFTAPPGVWNHYFEDIHAIDKVEKNFVLKLSYVLSKEMSFQLYKSINQGKDIKEASATYGNDICFPGDQLVTLANGSQKPLQQIQPGDRILTIDATTQQTTAVEVKQLVAHKAKNYAVTRLLLVAVNEQVNKNGTEVVLNSKVLALTPNHPVLTAAGQKKAGAVAPGDEVLCETGQAGVYQHYTVFNTTESADGVQQVYNMIVTGGNTFIMNKVMVLQK